MTETLAQQELLEAPPSRRLIVPAGHTAHWGIDPSTRGIALARAATPHGAASVCFAAFAKLRGAQRLSAIQDDTRTLVRGLLDGGWTPPGLIAIEQPFGGPTHGADELFYVVGVITAAVYDAVLEFTGKPAHIEMVSSSWWKKRACGNGGIRKPKRKTDPEYGVLSWARLNGYMGNSWDEADALAIAEAKRRDVLLEPR